MGSGHCRPDPRAGDEMTDLEFGYSGAELRDELEALVSRLESELAKLPAADIEAAKKPATLLTKQTSGEQRARSLIGALRDSRLWLYECYRTPEKTWPLNLLATDKLYPDDVLLAKLAEARKRHGQQT